MRLLICCTRKGKGCIHAGLLSAAVYGGRIDSAVDSTVLQAYINRIFDTRVMSGSLALPGAPAPLTPLSAASASASTVIGGAKRIADALSDIDTPATFGLAANVDRAELEASSVAAVAALRGLTARLQSSGAGAMDRATWRGQLAPIVRVWEGLVQASRPLQDARRIGRKESLRRQVCTAPTGHLLLQRHCTCTLSLLCMCRRDARMHGIRCRACL